MPLNESALDTAYAFFEEWGPRRREPRIARLTETFPDLTADEIESVLQVLNEVTKTVWKIAELGAEAKLGKRKVIETLQSEHPFLQSEGLRQAVFLVNYYAWHEGYAR